MDFDLLQHSVVTIVAFGAAMVIVRRVAGIMPGPTGDSKCDGCPSARTPRSPQQESPLTLVQNPSRR